MYASTTKTSARLYVLTIPAPVWVIRPRHCIREVAGNTFPANTWAKLTMPEAAVISGKDLENYREETFAFGVEGAAEMDDKCATELLWACRAIPPW